VTPDIGAINLADLGIREWSVTVLDVSQAERIAATLETSPAPRIGESLPRLWHWAFFSPTGPTSRLGPDGHPRLASPVLAGHPRRMWGAGVVEWYDHLLVGDRVERRSRIVDAKPTTGSSGSLVIVVLEHRYMREGVEAIKETQSLIYRPPGASVRLPEVLPTEPEPPEGAVQGCRRPDAHLLFRFSAITFNSHRIHYDATYSAAEGYPDLVVQGPLTSLSLARHVEASTGRPLRRWDFKATAPMFVDQWSIDRCGPVDDAGEGEATVIRCDGTTAMKARFALDAHDD